MCVGWVWAHVGQYLSKHYSQMSWIFLICVFRLSSFPSIHPSHPLKLPPGAKHTFTTEESIRYITTHGMKWFFFFCLVEKALRILENVINHSEVGTAFPWWKCCEDVVKMLAWSQRLFVAAAFCGWGGKHWFMSMACCKALIKFRSRVDFLECRINQFN